MQIYMLRCGITSKIAAECKTKAQGHQGNRISKHLQKAVEEVVIPACTFELSAQRTF
jgi:hypothetical protein